MADGMVDGSGLYPSTIAMRHQSSAIDRLRDRGIGLFWIDAVCLDRLLDDRGLDLAVARQRGERGDDHVAIVDLEELAESGARLAAAEPVGAEHGHRPRQPAIDRVGHRL